MTTAGPPYGEPSDGENVPIELETLIDGLFNTERFLQLLRNFTAFDVDGDGLVKRIAKPHQYFAVTKAVWKTVEAAESNSKAGVVCTPKAQASRWRWSSTRTWSPTSPS